MSVLSQFVGSRSVKVLTNEVISVPIPIPAIIGARQADVACAVAGQLYPVLSVSGAGALGFFSLRTMTATGQTLRVRISIDGTVAYDQTGTNFAGSGYGFVILGALLSDGTNVRALTHRLQYNSTLLLEISTSLAGATVRTHYINEVH